MESSLVDDCAPTRLSQIHVDIGGKSFITNSFREAPSLSSVRTDPIESQSAVVPESQASAQSPKQYADAVPSTLETDNDRHQKSASNVETSVIEAPTAVSEPDTTRGAARNGNSKMDQTQELSPTQENPESAYAQFMLPGREHQVRSSSDGFDNNSQEITGPGFSHPVNIHENTESTLRTYGENDTGHVNFDDLLAEPAEDDTQILSQDASFEPRSVLQISNEPQTPAPPVNPFTNQGTVLKAADLFAATQPSSAFRKGVSPSSSSRPTPGGLYSNFRTPQHQNFSSPIRPRMTRNGSSPLHSDVRNLLKVVSPDFQSKSSVQQSSPIRRTRVIYTSMKESQERRRYSSKPADLDTDNESDLEDASMRRFRMRKRNQKIQEELSAVELREKPFRKRPQILSSDQGVEIPSTRRDPSCSHSSEPAVLGDKEDIAGTEDEVIGDSQPNPSSSNHLQFFHDHIRASAVGIDTPRQTGTKLDDNSRTVGVMDEVDIATSSPHLSLPLQEIPVSRSNLHKHAAAEKAAHSDSVDTVIPETSPIADRLRPMREIASISFDDKGEQEMMDDFPGFTPDPDFERAIALRSSQASEALGVTSPLRAHQVANVLTPLNALNEDSNRELSTSPLTDLSPMFDDHNPVLFPVKEPEKSRVRAMGEFEVNDGPAPQPSPSVEAQSAHEQSPSMVNSTVLERSAIGEKTANPSSSLDRGSRETSMFLTPSKPPTRTYSIKTRALKGSLNVLTEIVPGKKSSKRKPSPPRSASLTARQTRSMSVDAWPSPVPTSVDPDRSLFDDMVFAISFVKTQESIRVEISKSIKTNGGRILDDGFDELFKDVSITSKAKGQANVEDIELPSLEMSSRAAKCGFTVLIADVHSRKAKYIQALALGIPCLSLRWVQDCVATVSILNWEPYLLSAGRSSYLSNAEKSRTLSHYPALSSHFSRIYEERTKILHDKSVLIVTGKGQAAQTRRAYVFLARVLGPARIGQVLDVEHARKKILSDLEQERSWDMLYVTDATASSARAMLSSIDSPAAAGSRKRKRGPAPKDQGAKSNDIRLLCDEDVVQSLILGKLLP